MKKQKIKQIFKKKKIILIDDIVPLLIEKIIKSKICERGKIRVTNPIINKIIHFFCEVLCDLLKFKNVKSIRIKYLFNINKHLNKKKKTYLPNYEGTVCTTRYVVLIKSSTLFRKAVKSITKKSLIENNNEVGIDEVVFRLKMKIKEHEMYKKEQIKINEENIKKIITIFFSEALREILAYKEIKSVQLKGFFKIIKRWRENREIPSLTNFGKKIYCDAKCVVRTRAGSLLKRAAKNVVI